MHRADDGEDGDSSPSGKLIAEMKVLAPRYRNCVSQFCAPAPCRVCAVSAPPAPAPRLQRLWTYMAAGEKESRLTYNGAS